MADEKASNKKNIIIGICAAAVIIIIIVAAALIIGTNKKLDDSYFVSDGSKYVLTIDYSAIASDIEAEDASYTPNKIHQVYTYSGDTITGLKYYYEYDNAEAAQAAMNYMQEEESGSDIAVTENYVVITASESDYSDYTASEIKETIEFYQNYTESEDSDDK